MQCPTTYENPICLGSIWCYIV